MLKTSYCWGGLFQAPLFSCHYIFQTACHKTQNILHKTRKSLACIGLRFATFFSLFVFFGKTREKQLPV